MGVETKIFKLCVIITSAILAVLAIVIICIGGYVANFLYEDAFLFDTEFITEATLILVIGVAVFIIAVCGFFGLVTRFKPILIVYIVILVPLVIAEIYYISKGANLDKALDVWVSAYYDFEYYPRPIGVLEKAFTCCAVEYRQKYNRSPPYAYNCCSKPIGNTCYELSKTDADCRARVKRAGRILGILLMLLFLGIIVVQVTALAFALLRHYTKGGDEDDEEDEDDED